MDIQREPSWRVSWRNKRWMGAITRPNTIPTNIECPLLLTLLKKRHSVSVLNVREQKMGFTMLRPVETRMQQRDKRGEILKGMDPTGV